MSAATATATTTPADVAPVIDLHDGASWLDSLRAARVVWKRELIRFSRNRIRIITSLAQPVLFLFVLGTGLSTIVVTQNGFDFRTFMFPGVICMTILFTAIFSAVSIVWDREFGFLREMLVAPVQRGAIMLGKCAGGDDWDGRSVDHGNRLRRLRSRADRGQSASVLSGQSIKSRRERVRPILFSKHPMQRNTSCWSNGEACAQTSLRTM